VITGIRSSICAVDRAERKAGELHPVLDGDYPGPIDFREPLPGLARGRAQRRAAAGYSSAASPSLDGRVMPRTPFTFSSISAIIAGLSLRKSFAFSRPWPIFWPL
jgi:hypothetical protein